MTNWFHQSWHEAKLMVNVLQFHVAHNFEFFFFHWADPAVIKHFIYVVGIDSINEASMVIPQPWFRYSGALTISTQSFAADIFFTQRWRDHRLRYPSSMSLNQSTINPDWLDDIWHPDVYFRNAKSIKLQTIPVPNRVLQIRNDKSIVNFWRLTLELSCAMNFALYPHDRHECKIEIESSKLIMWIIARLCYCRFHSFTTVSYPESVVKLMWGYRPLKMENKFQIPQLVLVEAYTKTSELKWYHFSTQKILKMKILRMEKGYRPYTSGNYSSLEVVFLLKRSMGYYLMTTYIPTCLIVVVSVRKSRQSSDCQPFWNFLVFSGSHFGFDRKHYPHEWLWA